MSEGSREPGPGRAWLWRGAWLAPLVVGPVWALAWSLPVRWPWPGFGTLSGAILAMLWIVTSTTDLRAFRIPNWATYPALVWSLVVHAGLSLATRVGDAPAVAAFAGRWLTPLSGLGDALLGLLLGGAALGVIYVLTGRGAGDVKLAAAIGAWIGPRPMALALVGTYCVAGVYALSRAVMVVGPWFVVRHLVLSAGALVAPQWVRSPRADSHPVLSEPVPMASFFALGTIVTLTWYAS